MKKNVRKDVYKRQEYACYDDEDNYEEFKQAILEKYDVKVVQATEKQAADKIV